VSRLDTVAVGWGGLAASLGLMLGAGRDMPVRLAIAGASFFIGGFLAGVRADARRPLHGLAAGVTGYLIHAVFVGLARLIDAFGGPDAPALLPGTRNEWLVAAGWALAVALLGGILAGTWLRPAGQRRRNDPRRRGGRRGGTAARRLD